ncbi:type VI secretion protein IcmF/TssM N-terminal domain-containing protein, partial [Pseudomonas aeruginosa]|uniref:type VI secretion protein IcmF/TssM N-terminal domain-containing protein n=1 Tax=Pseudomonas aeruginosa TaxID=287 RepID=UPI003CC63694
LPTLRNGRSRFIHDLQSQVIFPEANLAALDRRERTRVHWGQRALYVGSLALLPLIGQDWPWGFTGHPEAPEAAPVPG